MLLSYGFIELASETWLVRQFGETVLYIDRRSFENIAFPLGRALDEFVFGFLYHAIGRAGIDVQGGECTGEAGRIVKGGLDALSFCHGANLPRLRYASRLYHIRLNVGDQVAADDVFEVEFRE